ncbi:uncharacterized protein LOC109537051 isoform X2 [Dendroctonus ponderosae]|uniref:F-box domain-containing protein n=1 Tax=Dendroctonus ponderosae TaxID=77166 RepID=A0AAR5PE21_DENPD|nr:uncharacterized protein LOC109537051 isoform X2 [Dendroctonus ponderosae]
MGTEQQACNILKLSDCAMMYILSYLDATSLFNLSRTCLYFKNIVEDPQLWRYIDARHDPNSTKKIQYVSDRVHDKTMHILIRAESKYNGLLSQDILSGWSQLQQLTVLALENQRFDGRLLSLQNFPKSLVELSLKKTHVKNAKMFFQNTNTTMRNLKVLILDQCDWLDSNFFMSVAKYENLEILSIIKCMRLHLNVVPYLNVARYGCKKLKVVDCRFNTIAHEMLVQVHKNRVALYLQSMSSYELETGRVLLKLPHLTMRSRALMMQSTVKNNSLEPYCNSIGDLVEELPESILYQDPYSDCSCGWKDSERIACLIDRSTINEESNIKEEIRTFCIDDYIDFDLSHQQFICHRHMRELNKLPEDFKNFFYHNQKKFCPDSSDNDSDSDDDLDCCMFGVGKDQLIVLKVREADEQGNIPEPVVIDIFKPDRNLVNMDGDIGQQRAAEDRNGAEPDPQPSTSRGNSSTSSRNTFKRKAEPNVEDNDRRKMRYLEPERDADNAAGRKDEPAEAFQRFPLNAVDIPIIRLPAYQLQQDRIVMIKKDKLKLRKLSLRGYRKITDSALKYIQNLSLDLLDVTYTGVTREGIESFLNLNPNCRVLHQDYCICKPNIPLLI